MKLVLFLFLLPFAGIAQTVSLGGVSTAKEAQNGSRLVLVDISVANEEKTPVIMIPGFFYLKPKDGKGQFNSLGSIPSSNIQLSPGQKTSLRLQFEIASDLDVKSMTLCFHAPANEGWGDYLEIPFIWPAPARAPMWHLGGPGEVPDNKTLYHMVGKELKPPRLLHASDPVLPAGGREQIRKAGGQVTSLVSMIVDREGRVQQTSVVEPAGFGFDQEALLAVRQYSFEPARDVSGAPVAVKVLVKVNFRAY